jgi:uncharacterized protein
MPERNFHDQIFELASAAWDCGDIALAFDLFTVGAKHGDTSSKSNLGYFYDVGLFVPKNRSKALYWYRKAYRDGSCSAASNISTVYRDTKDYGRMIWWLRRAISMGDGDALLDLGRCYLRGIGVKKNVGRAADLFESVIVSEHVTDDGKENAASELKKLRKKK